MPDHLHTVQLTQEEVERNLGNGAKERILICFYMPQWISELSTNTPTSLFCLLNPCISTINEKKI